MYTRITRSGGRSYLQIVEGFRTQAGVRQRVVANLGRLDDLNGKKLDPLIHGLQRALAACRHRRRCRSTTPRWPMATSMP